MLPESPFHEFGEMATLDSVCCVIMPEGNPSCMDYMPVVLDIYGAGGKTFSQVMRELRAANEGHWNLGRESCGMKGWSRDASRRNPLNEGESL
jgi:hypothetical protein